MLIWTENTLSFSLLSAMKLPSSITKLSVCEPAASPDYARDPDSSGLGIRKNAVAL